MPSCENGSSAQAEKNCNEKDSDVKQLSAREACNKIGEQAEIFKVALEGVKVLGNVVAPELAFMEMIGANATSTSDTLNNIAAVIFFILLILLIWFFIRRKKTRKSYTKPL